MVTLDEFENIEIRSGRILSAEEFPAARKKAYRLTIDFGEFGIRSSSAQITERYSPSDLVGRIVLAVTNFPARRIAGFKSEVLVLGIPVEGGVVLIGPDSDVPPGSRVS